MTPDQLKLLKDADRKARRHGRKLRQLMAEILPAGHGVRFERCGSVWTGHVAAHREDGSIRVIGAGGGLLTIAVSDLVAEGEI